MARAFLEKPNQVCNIDYPMSYSDFVFANSGMDSIDV